MAILPEYARTATSYLGGGIARDIEKQGKRIVGMGTSLTGAVGSAGQKIQSAAKKVGMLGVGTGGAVPLGEFSGGDLIPNPIAVRVSNFLKSTGSNVSNLGEATGKTISGMGQSMQQFGSNVAGNVQGSMKKRDLGLIAAGMGVSGAFAGGALVGSAAAVATSRQSEEKRQRMAGDRPIIGGNIMPADLQAGYLNLAIPGSPLGGMGLLAGNHLRQGQVIQDALVAQQHRMKDAMVSYRGQLPLSYQTSEED